MQPEKGSDCNFDLHRENQISFWLFLFFPRMWEYTSGYYNWADIYSNIIFEKQPDSLYFEPHSVTLALVFSL